MKKTESNGVKAPKKVQPKTKGNPVKHIGIVKNDSWLEPYEDDVKHGPFLEKDKNGNITAKGEYIRGRKKIIK